MIESRCLYNTQEPSLHQNVDHDVIVQKMKPILARVHECVQLSYSSVVGSVGVVVEVVGVCVARGGGLSVRFIGCLEGHGSWKDVVLGTTVGLGRAHPNP